MTCGIYCYKDTKNNDEVVYVGKDSSIDKNTRHKRHHFPSRYDDQVINRILQNNPNRYTYHILKQGDFDDKLLNALEIIYTRRYKPKYSFTIGGDGSRGYKHSPESKKKISDALMGHEVSPETREKLRNHNLGKNHSKETREKLSKYRKGENNPSYRHDIPNGERLFKENRNGITYKKLCVKYNCSENLIIRRIREYKEEIGLL